MEMVLVEHDPDGCIRSSSEIGIVAGNQQVITKFEMDVREIARRLNSVDAAFHPSGPWFQGELDMPMPHTNNDLTRTAGQRAATGPVRQWQEPPAVSGDCHLVVLRCHPP